MLPSRKGVWNAVLQGGKLVTGLLSKAIEARRGGPSRVIMAGSFHGCRKDCSAGLGFLVLRDCVGSGLMEATSLLVSPAALWVLQCEQSGQRWADCTVGRALG